VNEVFDFRPTKTHPHLESQCGKAATCPEGTWEISRWYKPPVTCTKMPRAPAGAAEIVRRPFRRPCRGSPHFVVGTGGLHHRLISATPPASFILCRPHALVRNSAHLSPFLVVTKRLASSSSRSSFPNSSLGMLLSLP